MTTPNHALPLVPRRIVVVMPNWLGDAVMATPVLRALRGLFPDAHLAALHIPLVAAVLAGLPYIDEARPYTKRDVAAACAWLKQARFDLAVLLPNSFRAALLAYRAGIPHRLGYAREGRSFLLTDSLRPARRPLPSYRTHLARAMFRRHLTDWSRSNTPLLDVRPGHAFRCTYQATFGNLTTGTATTNNIFNLAPAHFLPGLRGYEPTPTIDYYLALATYLGASDPSKEMHLGITEAEREEAESALAGIGYSNTKPECLVTIVPGANFGASKCWPPEHFAAVARALTRSPYNAHILIASSPRELPIVDAILAHAPNLRVTALARLNSGRGVSLGALKEIVRRSRLMLCNDTGPRHFAAAFNIPTVTLFGPTDPRWAETYHSRERQVSIAVPCGPCQLKRCPTDHRCMTRLSPDRVLAAIAEVWSAPS